MGFFRNFLIDLFPYSYREEDSYKDNNGKGLFERYLQAFGDELDEITVPDMENGLNIINPLICDSKFLIHISDALGNPPDIFPGTLSKYRNLLRYILAIYKIKGTFESYKLFFYLLGYNVDIIVEPITSYNYDTEVIYDDIYTYDNPQCPGCYKYSLVFSDINSTLETIIPIDQATLDLLRSVVYFNEPINAKLIDLSNFIEYKEDLGICAENVLNYQIIRVSEYDQPTTQYDLPNILYDNGEILEENQVAFNCAGEEIGVGIGYWILEQDFIVS